MNKLNNNIFKIFTAWLSLMIIFSIGRLVFFVDFLPDNFYQKVKISEIIYIFIMGTRLDSSVVTALLFPLVILAVLFSFKYFNKLSINIYFKTWYYFVALLVIFSILLKHYFYYYYLDTFNIFFWEFWINWENSKLVIFSFFDELPILKISILVLFFITIFIIISRNLLKFIPVKLNQISYLKSKLFLFIWFIIFLLGMRSTFNGLPLSMQEFKGQISSDFHLNTTHSNPFYSLYNSWNNDIIKSVELRNNFKNSASLNNYKSYFQQEIEGSRKEIINAKIKNKISLVYNVPDLHKQYLIKKPKHIVVFFMESFFSWPMTFQDDDFMQKVAGNFLKLKKDGIYFDNYFQAGAGTIQNLTKAVLGIATPKTVPNDNEFSEALKKFPGNMPVVMEKAGYKTSFFYGGSLAWHNLGYFMKQTGFSNIYSEKDVIGVHKHRFGLYDQDLFNFIHNKLSDSKKPSFYFIMTLSNHPPYQIPKSYKSPIKLIPQKLEKIVEDKELFYKRFKAFSYSDKVLGDFFKNAHKSEYFDDTLFIITADHTVHAPFKWPAENEYHIAKIPLLFYAPKLLKYSGKTISPKGTHFDLVPTILSIINNSPKKIQHWGKSLFVKNKTNNLYSFYLDCLNDICQYQNTSYQLINNDILKYCNSDKCVKTVDVLSKKRLAFDNSGLYYLLNYQN